MKSDLEKLLSCASSSICNEKPIFNESIKERSGKLINELEEMLNSKNGYYAFESALHVFPSCSTDIFMGLDTWNEESLWISEYKGLASDCLFFAEDVFGCQFCIKDNQIHTFDPETGEINFLANNFNNWAKEIVSDYEVLTGYALAHQWQVKNEKLLSGKRLLPKTPFVVGGRFEIDNLYLCDSVVGMKFRASIANQIKDLPDGTPIEFKEQP